jgi:rare lipoprotein A
MFKKICIIVIVYSFGLASCNTNNDKTFQFVRVKGKYSKIYKEDKNIDSSLAKKVHLKGGKYEGYFKVGNPYKIFDTLYVPQDYEEFEEVGIASWYGDDFHGKQTANGEIYNMGSMTAAHRTLPLPSIVKVTNLQNNKSVIVRVNDRGPFAKNRVIDLSERAANLLEYKNKGTAKVKIELMRYETDKFLESLQIK